MQLTQWWGFLLSSPILPTAKELSWINHPISCYPHIWYLLLPLIQTAAPSWDSSSSRRCRQRSLCFCVCPVSSASQHYSKWGRTWPLFSLLQQAALQKLTKSISKAWRADPWLQRAQSMYSSAHWRLADPWNDCWYLLLWNHESSAPAVRNVCISEKHLHLIFIFIYMYFLKASGQLSVFRHTWWVGTIIFTSGSWCALFLRVVMTNGLKTIAVGFWWWCVCVWCSFVLFFPKVRVSCVETPPFPFSHLF